MHNNAFEILLQDLATVFADADTSALLSKDVIPSSGFHEPKPENIVRSYEQFIKPEQEIAVTSVAQKLTDKAYETPYGLYHDVTLVCGVEIVKYEVGSSEYQEIDRFHVFATKLLLSEVEKLGSRLFEEEKSREEDELLDLFRDDFEKISQHHLAPNGEFVTYIHKYTEPSVPGFHAAYNSQTEPEAKTVVQPLFSGLIGRSILDTRNTVLPDPWSLTKVVAAGANSLNNTTIKSFNSVSCKIPLPTQASAQVLEGFFHPNWYTIEAPKWLQYKQKTLKPPLNSTLVKNCDANELRVQEKKSNIISLGPTIDSRNSVLSEDVKQKIWFSNIGLKQAQEIKNKLTQGTADDAAEVEESSAEETKEIEKNGVENGVEVAAEDKMDVDEENAKAGNKAVDVKLENLIRFVPEAVSSIEELRKDQARILKSPHEMQKVISLHLLKLNKLRQERYLHSTSPATPSIAETLLYKKVVKLLSLLARSDAANQKPLNLQLSRKIPILLNDYQGVLPGPIPAKPVAATKSSRLAGIKGQYKKKGRFQ